MHTLRARPFLYFTAGIAVTVAAAWSMTAWQASAGVSPDESTFVSVSPTRILDTREDIGLGGPFVSAVAQDLRVTGTIPTKSGTIVVVPDGATGVILNVTAVSPTAAGFVSVRPADAPGVPTTSSLNFTAGQTIPNSVTVQMPTTGGDAGEIEITYDAFGQSGPTTEMLVDVVGYTKNAGLASLQAEVDLLETQVAQFNTTNGQIVFDGDAASGALAGTYPNPGLAANSVVRNHIADDAIGTDEIVTNAITADEIAPNAVGASELIDDTVGLIEMNAIIVDSATTPTGPPLANGTCTGELLTPAAGADVGGRTLVLLARQSAGGANAGWVVEGMTTTTPDQASVQVCNYTAVAGTTAQPEMVISFIVLGP